jgi:hypothetical protein
LHLNCAVWLAGSATLTGIIDCTSTCAYVCACLLGTLQSLLLRRRVIVSGPFGRSSGSTASKICRLSVPAGWGGSCCRWGRFGVCPCKQLTHRHQVVVVVVGNDELGSAAWKELRFGPGIPAVALRFCFFSIRGYHKRVTR